LIEMLGEGTDSTTEGHSTAFRCLTLKKPKCLIILKDGVRPPIIPVRASSAIAATVYDIEVLKRGSRYMCFENVLKGIRMDANTWGIDGLEMIDNLHITAALVYKWMLIPTRDALNNLLEQHCPSSSYRFMISTKTPHRGAAPDFRVWLFSNYDEVTAEQAEISGVEAKFLPNPSGFPAKVVEDLKERGRTAFVVKTSLAHDVRGSDVIRCVERSYVTDYIETLVDQTSSYSSEHKCPTVFMCSYRDTLQFDFDFDQALKREGDPTTFSIINCQGQEAMQMAYAGWKLLEDLGIVACESLDHSVLVESQL